MLILKRGNLDKFESRSFGDIFLGYTLHGYSYRVFNLEINTIIVMWTRVPDLPIGSDNLD